MSKLKNSHKAYLIIIPLILAAVSGCGLVKSEKSFPNDPLVDRSFVTSQPCEAPCWYGLRLGDSTLEDIRTTLPELPFVDKSQIYEQPIGDFGPNERSFLVHCTYSKEAEFCAILETSQNGKLSKIIVIVAYELTLQTTIEDLGVPEFYNVSPSPNKDICYVN